MADDTGATGGSGGPRGPGMGGCCSFLGGFRNSVNSRGHGQGCKRWIPVTKLCHLVKNMKVKSLEEIQLFSLAIKESEINDFFVGTSFKDEVLKIMLVQKQTHAGEDPVQGICCIKDYNGHASLGVKCSKEVATAIHGAVIPTKLSTSVWRGYWENKISKLHTIPCKVTSCCGSVFVCLIHTLRALASSQYMPLVSMTATPQPGAALSLWATSPRPATCDPISKTYSYFTPNH